VPLCFGALWCLFVKSSLDYLSVWGICDAFLFRIPVVPVCLERLWCLFCRNPWYLLIRAAMSSFCFMSLWRLLVLGRHGPLFVVPVCLGQQYCSGVYLFKPSICMLVSLVYLRCLLFCDALVRGLFGALSVWSLSNLALVKGQGQGQGQGACWKFLKKFRLTYLGARWATIPRSGIFQPSVAPVAQGIAS
jgi:hypothetical protein